MEKKDLENSSTIEVTNKSSINVPFQNILFNPQLDVQAPSFSIELSNQTDEQQFLKDPKNQKLL